MNAEFARDVMPQTDDEWYYVTVLEQKVPNAHNQYGWRDFEGENADKLIWWCNFCYGVNEGDDESVARIINYDSQNFEKLQALATWSDNNDLLDRLYQYELSLSE